MARLSAAFAILSVILAGHMWLTATVAAAHVREAEDRLEAETTTLRIKAQGVSTDIDWIKQKLEKLDSKIDRLLEKTQ
jgi:hydroxymethylglutaryl-CoA reductase